MKTKPSRIKSWMIEYPVKSELKCHEIQGEALERALSDYWTANYSSKANPLTFKVHFVFGNEAWCTISHPSGKPLAYTKFGKYRIISILRGDRSGHEIHEDLTSEELTQRMSLYQFKALDF
jgi:hypothetical protein